MQHNLCTFVSPLQPSALFHSAMHMHCHPQATAAARVRLLTTAQFVWLAFAALARSTGMQEQSRWPPSGAHLVQYRCSRRPTWLLTLGVGSAPYPSRQPLFLPRAGTPHLPSVSYVYLRDRFGPFSLALAPCRDRMSP